LKHLELSQEMTIANLHMVQGEVPRMFNTRDLFSELPFWRNYREKRALKMQANQGWSEKSLSTFT
jgi:hypothetical protein